MRLPDITYNQTAPVDLIGPGAAVTASSQRIALVNQALQGAKEIANAHREYELNKTYANYNDEMTAFRNEAAKERVVSPAKIMAWGLDDVIDTEGRDWIPRSEWYPIALDRQMEQARKKYRDKIASPIDRIDFDQKVGEANNAMLSREIEIAQKEAWQEQDAVVRADVADYVDSGRYDSAISAVQAHSGFTPSDKQVMIAEITARHDDNQVRDELQALTAKNDVSGLQEYAAYLRTDEANERFSIDDKALDAWAARADATAKGIVDGAEISSAKMNKAINAQNYNAVQTMIRDGNPISIDMINQLSADAAARGDFSAVKGYDALWENYVAQGGNSTHAMDGKGDRDLYEMLSLMDREKLKDEQLEQYGARLDRQQFETLFNRQVSFRNAKEAAPTSTPANIFNSHRDVALDAAGLLALPNTTTSNSEDNALKKGMRAKLVAAYTDAVTTREIKEGRALTSDEAQEIADAVAIPYIKAEYETKSDWIVWSGTTTDTGTLADMIVANSRASENDKPKVQGQLVQIVKEIMMEGEPVTEEAVLQRYKELNP